MQQRKSRRSEKERLNKQNKRRRKKKRERSLKKLPLMKRRNESTQKKNGNLKTRHQRNFIKPSKKKTHLIKYVSSKANLRELRRLDKMN